MYMSASVGVAELRQNLSRYLDRVARGERLVVTEHNRPVAELIPLPTSGDALDRLVASGRVQPPLRATLPGPWRAPESATSLSRALEDVRGDI